MHQLVTHSSRFLSGSGATQHVQPQYLGSAPAGDGCSARARQPTRAFEAAYRTGSIPLARMISCELLALAAAAKDAAAVAMLVVLATP